MMTKKDEKEDLTIHEKWEEDSDLYKKEEGLGFDDSEWEGDYIKIERYKEKE
jgi:hypothetical protein